MVAECAANFVAEQQIKEFAKELTKGVNRQTF